VNVTVNVNVADHVAVAAHENVADHVAVGVDAGSERGAGSERAATELASGRVPLRPRDRGARSEPCGLARGIRTMRNALVWVEAYTATAT
jgi:hypothetical protein